MPRKSMVIILIWKSIVEGLLGVQMDPETGRVPKETNACAEVNMLSNPAKVHILFATPKKAQQITVFAVKEHLKAKCFIFLLYLHM